MLASWDQDFNLAYPHTIGDGLDEAGVRRLRQDHGRRWEFGYSAEDLGEERPDPAAFGVRPNALGYARAERSRGDRYRSERFDFLMLPAWVGGVPLAACLVLGGLRRWRRSRARRLGLCVNCSYDLRGSGAECPECGYLVELSGAKASPDTDRN